HYVLKVPPPFKVPGGRNPVGARERAALVGRVRALARKAAEVYLAERERLGYPLLQVGAWQPGAGRTAEVATATGGAGR
ncbi:MAG: glycine--tRNA ligase subunit alpha, partial [Bacillota bacterium]